MWQALLTKPDVKRATQQATKYGYDVDAYLKALAQAPIVTEEGFKKALSLFNEMTVILAEQGLKELRHRQTESRMRLSEAQLRTLVNTLPDIVWLKDPNGIYLGCNYRFERLFGAKEAEIIGKTDFDSLKKAVAYGTVVASFTIEDFSLAGLTSISKADIDGRLGTLREVTSF